LKFLFPLYSFQIISHIFLIYQKHCHKCFWINSNINKNLILKHEKFSTSYVYFAFYYRVCIHIYIYMNIVNTCIPINCICFVYVVFGVIYDFKCDWHAQHQLPNIFMHKWVKTWENKKRNGGISKNATIKKINTRMLIQIFFKFFYEMFLPSLCLCHMVH
jgi:hypothetical protein